MNYKQIDEQLLLELCNLYQDFLSESEVYDGADFWGNSRVKEIRKQLHDQAKAEQREEDARITEGMNVGEEAGFVLSLPKFVKRDNEMFNGGYNRAVADIAKAIREAK